MSVSTFKASHCGETFEGLEGAKALEAHMLKAHERKMLVPGANVNGEIRCDYNKRAPQAAGWSGGRIQPPTPWKAPSAPRTTHKLTEVLAKAQDEHWMGESVLVDWTTNEKSVPASELRAGDVFVWASRVYVVNAVEGDTLAMTIRKAGKSPERTGRLDRSQIATKAPEGVAIIRRAA